MAKILVTGGTGYIGSHTIVDLIENGFDVISIDNFSRSTTIALAGIEKITGKKVKNYTVDLKNFDETQAVFQENQISLGKGCPKFFFYLLRFFFTVHFVRIKVGCFVFLR